MKERYAFLKELEDWFENRIEDEFNDSSEGRKQDILEFLEQFMDLADKADEVATKLIFKGSYLEAISGVKAQK